MKYFTRLFAAALCLGAVLLSGCSTFEGHEGAATGTAIGAVGGAAIGAAAAGKGKRGQGALIGGAIGGVGGGVAGDQLHDKKDR